VDAAIAGAQTAAAGLAARAPGELLVAAGGVLAIALVLAADWWRVRRRTAWERARRQREIAARQAVKRRAVAEYREQQERLRPLEDAIARGVRRGTRGW
jgi:hypothetical protein